LFNISGKEVPTNTELFLVLLFYSIQGTDEDYNGNRSVFYQPKDNSEIWQ